ncbi:phosphatase PAP2 family protein [Actinoplanes sp. NPDC051470]|uniref:phosphatase PAP2 family protein n=1 Tax=unclassified Actinoplanes TaxID=2626549 RepID=UPI00343A37DB
MIPRVRPSVPATAAILYVLLTVAVLAGWLRAVDRAGADAFRAFGAAHPALIDTVTILTDAAETIPFLVAGLTLGAILRVRRKHAAGHLVWSVTALIPILWSLFHLLLPHARPPDGFVQVASYGFPSGHTANAAAAALVAILLLAPPGFSPAALPGALPGVSPGVSPFLSGGSSVSPGHRPSVTGHHAHRSRRAVVWTLAIAFALVIGLTRVVLLAHYPSQVLGGFLLAAAVVPALANLVARLHARAARRAAAVG